MERENRTIIIFLKKKKKANKLTLSRTVDFSAHRSGSKRHITSWTLSWPITVTKELICSAKASKTSSSSSKQSNYYNG